MRRRQALRRIALLGAVGLAGCTSRGPSGGGTNEPGAESPPADGAPSPTDPGTGTGTDGSATPERTPDNGNASDTPAQNDRPGDEATPTVSGGIDEYSFEVTARSGGRQIDSAAVSADAATVSVSGTIWGADACQTAELDAVTLSDGALFVRVREVREAGAEACAQVVVEIDYEVTVTLASEGPERVVVTHDHGPGPRTVTETSV